MMIDLELLEELVAFQQYGTLSATAEHLMITQPSVTRGMKKLEQELGVTLFNREVNRVALNETGQLAASEAKKLLQAENDFTEKVLNFDQMQKYIHIGSVAPGPLFWSEDHKDEFEQDLTFNHQLVKPKHIISDLRNYKERLIFTSEEIMTDEDDIESMYLGKETLLVKIDKFNPLSQKESVTFNDLKGMSFLEVQDIGPWRRLTENNIPDAKFLYQEDIPALEEISKYSKFPVFRSNLTMATSIHDEDDERTLVPIVDPKNEIEIYGTYLTSQRKIIQPFLKEVIKKWPN